MFDKEFMDIQGKADRKLEKEVKSAAVLEAKVKAAGGTLRVRNK